MKERGREEGREYREGGGRESKGKRDEERRKREGGGE